jgi:hypothetical protein
VYNAVAKLWKPWLDEEAISTLSTGKWKIYPHFASIFIHVI